MALISDIGAAKPKAKAPKYTPWDISAEDEAKMGLGGPAIDIRDFLGGTAADEDGGLASLLNDFANQFAAAQEAQSASDRAFQDWQKAMAEQEFAFEQEKFKKQMELEREQFEFEKQAEITDKLLEAAGLAVGPAGAIQLAFMARGQGAPQEEIRNIFQNLPFVKSLLAGEALPGFGLPEQLGGASARTANTTTGGTFGLTLPSETGVTEQQWSGLSDFEKLFLGDLVQAETGKEAGMFLKNVQKSFIPTTGSFLSL